MNISTGKYLYTALSGVTIDNVALTVYPVIADFNSTTPSTPFAVYHRTAMTPGYTKDLYDNSITHAYNVIIVDKDYATSIDYAQAAINAMLALSHTTQSDMRINQVLVQDLVEDYLDGLFLQTITIELNTTSI